MKKIVNLSIDICVVMLLVGCLHSCNTKKGTLKFAIASDFHAQDIPDGKERVLSFIRTANEEDVDFIIELGDFCRLDSMGQEILAGWNSYKGDKYHVIGNHDMDNYDYKEYTKGMKMPGRYYSFDKGDFHFIVLDGNNVFDGQKYYHYAKANYFVDAKRRAYIDPEQMEWLKKDLAATEKKCVLFSHQSIDTFMNNGADVRRILEDENVRSGFKKIVLAFSGHNHSNYTKEINGITYMQINSASYVWIDQPSMTEQRYPQEINEKYPLLKYSITYDKPLYAIVTLNKDEAVVKGRKSHFMPPTPQNLNMRDSIGVFPLVSIIENVNISFRQ